jgi:hypothetical protein
MAEPVLQKWGGVVGVNVGVSREHSGSVIEACMKELL